MVNKKKAIYLGSKEFGFKIFNELFFSCSNFEWELICPNDLEDSRSCYKKFLNFSDEHNINIQLIENSKLLKDYLYKDNFEIMFVNGYYRILSDDLLDQFPLGVFGIHNSLLPTYRGGSPLVWQIINDEKKLGSTLFKFDKGFDNGPIISQVTIENNNLTIKEATELIQSEWLKIIGKTWVDLTSGKLSYIEQNEKEATYCAQRIEVDGLIDWTKNSHYIERFIRAQSEPYPRAFFYLDKKKYRINKHLIDHRKVCGVPGQIFEVKKSAVTICCGDNTIIKILEIDDNGKNKHAYEILNSINLRVI